ncbi:dihydrolipoyllysine-residue succinyltransferase component of oxoglutarate dehydrogenase [Cystoisospora suis]|uniref:Dihydrolipoyllysine-residue succinyltransferase component of oxoglutarate dehydrogenase n=1 Tax=Cystoisospora suis TaxID=483139 RepID=A0A2C6KPY1_9APIC|nr:dihydrolipoyllysine-residue succinyltransferase component of oxoglutarate dehydrogenase [Cystoisospora suis]
MTLMDSASRKGLSFLFLSRRLPRQGGSSSCQKQQSHPSPLIHFRAGPVPSTPAYIRVLSKGDGSPLRLKEVSSSSSCSYSFLLRSSLIERKPSSHFPTISLAPSSRFFNVGDYVQEGDLLAVIDTDKVSVDVTAPISGRLVKFEAKEGETIEVGKPLYIIDPSASPPPPGEKSSSASSSSPPPPPPTRAPAAPPPSSSSPTPPPFPPPTSTPASVSPSSPSAPGSGSPQSQGGGILSSSSSSSFLGRGVKPSTKAEGENVLTAAPDHSGEKRVRSERRRR